MVGFRFTPKNSKVILSIVLALTAILIYFIPSLGFDYNFEKFFPKSDKEADFFYEHRARFESDNDFLLIAIENKNGIFESDFLKKVAVFTGKLRKEKHVTYVQSIVDMQQVFLFPTGGRALKKYIDLDSLKNQKEQLKNDSTTIYKHVELVESLIAKDGKSLCVFVRHTDFLSKKKSDYLIGEVQKLSEQFGFEKIRIAGRTIGQNYYIEKMTFEMLFYVSLSLILVVVFLWFSFRSAWGILIPQIVIILTMIWVIGSMAVLNEPINIVLTILPSILFVVGMSDVIHLVSRYLDALRLGSSKQESISIALKEVGFATLLTSLTTAIGFLTLMFVQVQPIQVFGFVTGIGVMIAFLLTIVMLPVLFLLFPSPKNIIESKSSEKWKALLSSLFIKTLKKRKLILICTSVVTLLLILASTQMKVNNFLMDDLRESEPIKQDFRFLDDHYGGIRPLEIGIHLKDTNQSIWDADILADLEKIENYLATEYQAKINVSLVQTLKVLNRSSYSGNPSYFKLPTKKSQLRKSKQLLRIANQGKWLATMLDSTETHTRIGGNIGDWGNVHLQKKNEAFKRFLKQNIDTQLLEVNITGTAHLIDKNMRYLSTNLIQGIIVSILLITFLMGLLFISLRMVAISLIPNLIPLLVLSGIMGLVGIDLKISTAIIFTIAFGIAVDDTIHFLGKFKFELQKGKSKLYALKRTYITTGKAMILTTLILCCGFAMLIFSSFMGTFIMGLMITVTLLSALILDLTVLPILILIFYHPKEKQVVKKS